MDWPDWRPTYVAILEEFGWSEQDDQASARLLAGLLAPESDLAPVEALLRGAPVANVVGCGPGLEELQPAHLAAGPVVSADGATKRLREIGVVPHLVITDLDGDADALRWASRAGSLLLVHAHGHNQDAIRAQVPALGPAAGSCQCEATPDLAPLVNLGGFTDGDRAVLLCEEMGVSEARLVGFELDAPPSRYSGAWDPETKKRKLAWATRILAGVDARSITRLQSIPTHPAP